MRLFIAVNLPQNTLEKIEEITDFFKKKTAPAPLKWVEMDHLHLTVKFIGEIDDLKVNQIEKILNRSLETQAPFEIEVCGLGMYPHNNHPRVIWLGITGGEPLVRLHNVLDEDLAALGIKREGQPFASHLTIARVRRNATPSSVKSIGQTLSQFTVEPLGAITIDHVHLYQSVLTPSGPIYTPLFSVPLNQV